MAKLDVSGIRKVFELGAKLADPIDLSIGQPDFPVPEQVKSAAIEAIRADRNGYTVTQGIAELRSTLAERLSGEFGWNEPSVMISSGVSGALLLAFMATLNPGDEVLIPDPYFVMYQHLPRLIGAVPVTIDTYPDFRLDPDRIESAITSRTKILILCSPSNPTGVVASAQEVDAVCQLARKHNLLLISDEIYDLFCYEPHVSAGRYSDDLLLLRGFSKSYAMTGWRMGYAAGPKQLIEEMNKLQQYTFVCAPSMVQWAGLTALEVDMSAEIADYRRKRDMVYSGLMGRYELVKSGGAFYLFVPAPGGDATAFCQHAVENNLLIIPGSVFSGRDTHFRISYATSDAKLKEGINILNQMAERI